MSSKLSTPDPDATNPQAPLRPASGARRALPPGDATPRVWPRRTLLGTLAAAGLGGGVWWAAGQVLPGTSAPATSSGPSSSATVTTPAQIALDTDRGYVRADFVSPGVARFVISDAAGERLPFSYAVDRDRPAFAEAELSETSAATSLRTDELTLAVDRRSGAVTVTSRAGAQVIEETSRGFQRVGSGLRWQVRLAKDESCYGLGERAFPLSLRGRKVTLWNHDAGSYPPGSDPLYLNVPFYLGQRKGLSYGVFWDCPARGSVDLDTSGDGELTFAVENGPLVCYVVTGAGPRQVVERFTQLTGTMDLIPLWALGYHQSRWGYPDAAHFKEVAARMRRERIPCDALYFDIDYMDGFRDFTWDPTRFPDPAGLLRDLKKRGFHTVAILDPGVKRDTSDPIYRSATSHDVFLKRATGELVSGKVWPGVCNFPDFTSPTAREWWAGQVTQFAKVGFDGLWNDMNEPATFSDATKTLPDDTHHDWEGEGRTHVAGGHAVYGMQMARSTREGLSALRPQRRPFVLTRAGYAGVQRYATTWNGDSLATWEHLRLTIPQVCSLGISGIAFSGADAGGFRGEPGAELYLRWMQLGSMLPYFRTHSAYYVWRNSRRVPVQERHPWTYGEPYTSRIRAAIEQRYQLLPYLYTQAQRAATQGTPIVRPLFFSEPDNDRFRAVDDQFLLGDDLLVAPILTRGSRSRRVWLPKGTWFDFGASTRHSGGGRVTSAAGWGLPLFVRAGAVIPTWPVLQSVERAPDRLLLDVYAGSSESTLYEDAGDGFGFQRDEYRASTFTTAMSGRELELDWNSVGRFAPTASDVEVRIHGLQAKPTAVTVDGKPVPLAAAGPATLVSLSQRFQRLVVQF